MRLKCLIPCCYVEPNRQCHFETLVREKKSVIEGFTLPTTNLFFQSKRNMSSLEDPEFEEYYEEEYYEEEYYEEEEWDEFENENQNCYDWHFLISFIPSIICFILILLILTKSICELKKSKSSTPKTKNKTNINPIIKYLYLISSTIAILVAITCIVASFHRCHWATQHAFYDPDITLSPIAGGLYFILILTILATLLFRLYITFKGSMFSISKCQKWSFLVLFSLSTVSACIAIILLYVVNSYTRNIVLFAAESPLLSIYSVIFGVFYTLTSIYGMVVFCRKMHGITKLQMQSLRNVTDINNVSINKRQQKLLDAASKYISLLSIAIISTFLGFVAFGIVISGFRWMPYDDPEEEHSETFEFWRTTINFIVLPLDCTVNILCLYLQFPFAKDTYRKYCGCCSKCWKLVLVKRTERTLMKKFLEYESERANSVHTNSVASVSSVSQPQDVSKQPSVDADPDRAHSEEMETIEPKFVIDGDVDHDTVEMADTGMNNTADRLEAMANQNVNNDENELQARNTDDDEREDDALPDGTQRHVSTAL